jgi:hypothetical protein
MRTFAMLMGAATMLVATPGQGHPPGALVRYEF